MKTVLNIILVAAAVALCYLFYTSLREPIEFNNERQKREGAVVDQLKDIRTTQELYRNITGQFAPTFDTLKQVLNTRQLFKLKTSPDPAFPDDPDKFITDTIFYNTMDSINAMAINLDSLHFVPFGKGELFSMTADTLTYQQTLVYVMECRASRQVFMGKYSDPAFSKYDDTYDPAKVIKFGDMTAPSLSGNWE